jgi:hypothetical protein
LGCLHTLGIGANSTLSVSGAGKVDIGDNGASVVLDGVGPQCQLAAIIFHGLVVQLFACEELMIGIHDGQMAISTLVKLEV